jgi:hypothetical protein
VQNACSQIEYTLKAYASLFLVLKGVQLFGQCFELAFELNLNGSKKRA